MSANIILVDNFDSFTYNLVDQFRASGHHVTVFRNSVPIDVVSATIESMTSPALVLSPGPGHPKDAGCMPRLIKDYRGRIPIIGDLPRSPSDYRSLWRFCG